MAMGPVSGRGGRNRAPMAEINVTPLVDVMLVLLIIFMITAPLLTAGVPVNLPDSNAKALDQDQAPLDVALDDKGQVYIGDEPVADAVLPARLAQAAAARSGKDVRQVFLRADRTLDYGRVMMVMGELDRAGLDRVALVTTQAKAAR